MLKLAFVVPHGDEVLVPDNKELKELQEGMIKAGKKIKDEKIEEYILISPHNIRIDTHIGVILTQYASGSWHYKNLRFRRRYKCDRELAEKIYKEAKSKNIPVVGINFGALEGEMSNIPLDWGSLIPLYFLPKNPIVLLTPARKIRREELVKFGEILGKIMDDSDKKIALIVSADHAHTHSREGPYGYSPKAREYDEEVIKYLKKGNLAPLLSMSDEFLEEVKPDSYWQLLILHGVMNKIKMKNEFMRYGIADYFGMAVAFFTRI